MHVPPHTHFSIPSPDWDTNLITSICWHTYLYIFQIKDKQDDTISFSLLATHTATQHDTHLYSALCVTCIMQRNLPHLVGSDGVSKITVILYVTPCSLVEQQQCFRKTFCFQDSRRWRHQAPLLTFLKLRSLRSQKTMCRGNDTILILLHLAAFCH